MDDEQVVSTDLIPETEELVVLVKGATNGCSSSWTLAGTTVTSSSMGTSGWGAWLVHVNGSSSTSSTNYESTKVTSAVEVGLLPLME